jgi:hypothetical protein
MLKSTRFDAETCSMACRKACSPKANRGGDLEYLRDLPDDQARSRRFLHEAIRDEIELERMIRAQRRDYREMARRKRQARPAPAPAISRPAAPPHPHYAPDSFFVLKET